MLHIDLPARSEIDALLDHRGVPAVSIYVRTTPVTQDTKSDRIELKNLLKTALTEMEEGGVAKREVEAISVAVEALIADDDFWVTQANSLAIFVTPDRIRTYRLPNRLQNTVEVSDRFHLKPLIRAVTFPNTAYVLTLSMGAVRLIEVDADLPPEEIKVPDMPANMASALHRRSHGERTGEGRSGEQTSEHALLLRYSRAVDQALRPVLAHHSRPLILAAVEPVASAFRSVCSYGHLAAEGIAGSQDQTPIHELAAAARPVLDRTYAQDIAGLAELFANRIDRNQATTDIAIAARAATFGAVDTLIVDMDAVVAGTVSEDDGAVTFGEAGRIDTYGVIDEIARRALRSGARVVSVRRADVPGGGDLAAILRYAF